MPSNASEELVGPSSLLHGPTFTMNNSMGVDASWGKLSIIEQPCVAQIIDT